MAKLNLRRKSIKSNQQPNQTPINSIVIEKKKSSDPEQQATEKTTDDDLLASVLPSGLPKDLEKTYNKSKLTYGWKNVKGQSHEMTQLHQSAKQIDEEYLEILPPETAEMSWFGLHENVEPEPEEIKPNLEEKGKPVNKYIPEARHMSTNINGPFPDEWNKKPSHLEKKDEPPKEEIVPEQKKEEVPEKEIVPEQKKEEEAPEKEIVPEQKKEEPILPVDVKVEPPKPKISEQIAPPPPPPAPAAEIKPPQPEIISKPKPKPEIKAQPQPKPKPQQQPEIIPQPKPKPQQQPVIKPKPILQQPEQQLTTITTTTKKKHHPRKEKKHHVKNAGDGPKSFKHNKMKSMYPAGQTNYKAFPFVNQQMHQNIPQAPAGPNTNSFELTNYGVMPARTAAFKAPFVPLSDAGVGTSVTLDSQGHIIDCEEDGVKFKFKPRPNFATEISFTVEPQKKQKWQTMMNCGFTPLIYCNVPPACLPGNCPDNNTNQQQQFQNCGPTMQMPFNQPQGFPRRNNRGDTDEESSTEEEESTDEDDDDDETSEEEDDSD